MDGYAGQQAENLEDRIRRMALLNSSVPDAGEYNTTPRVRLPPAPLTQQPPSLPPFNPPHQREGSWHSGSSSPASPFNQQAFQRPMLPPGYQQAPPQMAPPSFQRPSGHPQPAVHTLPSPGSGPVYQGHPPQYAQHSAPGFRGSIPSRGRGGPPRQQRHQQIQLDPDAFQRGGPVQNNVRNPPSRHLFDPNARRSQPPAFHNDYRERQAYYLEQVATAEVANVEMNQSERDEKESFRKELEKLCHEVCIENPQLPNVSLECFGSFQSGFASAGSDMDLVIVVQDNSSTAACFSLLENDLPRELERKLLITGHGARLLTRTRVPIIKVCQGPGSCLLSKLRVEREKWDFLPNEKKYPHLHQDNGDGDDDDVLPTATGAQLEEKTTATAAVPDGSGSVRVEQTKVAADYTQADKKTAEVTPATAVEVATVTVTKDSQPPSQNREQFRTWTRERKAGPLDFPKDGVGIQCDINFFNPLGLHNTQMLRCYSLCDPRVRPIVLFVKSWAKARRINSSYSGTLSSYGYVMMVLHYLMNVAQPPVLPNLQSPWRPNQACTQPGATRTEVDGWVVDFWRNEDEIKSAVQKGQMSCNQESLGSLLAGFFQYYSSMGNGPQFRWTQQVLSLRTQGGILTKEMKGWVKATTEEGEGKKIQHRYLFCIEDPFELTHNVARTVTHNGIVAIRDEFRRANRILHAIGNGYKSHEGELFTPLVEAQDLVDATKALSVANGDAKADQVKEQPERLNSNGQTKQKTLDGAADRPLSQQGPKPKAKALDVADQNAFPSLGAASKVRTRGKKSNGQKEGEGEGFASIDGQKAQAHLEEFRRKKAEAQAEHTAMGAAEAVLNGDD
ncbi:hypothetical protein M409DRAFT_55568 [Zasmidium cellare ATCC 36951]|uniref:polynucleotide adenylyltransferase n=1 Tax=Zasmidium cellare ATCC 36951 TaxID=1080233 RepID=A0A6A6CI97_ZASCE|nr:uncharacterized protein M409DRAFT_55568 [Zasmidium cellare ATCC 36951]KAF2165682.1 hypothetical protein M409DRAFT_55568 [Zasmidium cellare ATCC 36951]